jgi:acyl carrier protein
MSRSTGVVAVPFCTPGRWLREWWTQVNEVERAVVAVVADVLGTSEIDPSANFFDLGGDSLAALEVTGRLIEDLDRDIPLDALFDAVDLTTYAAVVAALPPLSTSA